MVTAGTTTAPAAGDRYTPIAILLHWLTAVLVLCMIAAGLTMVRLPPGDLQNLLFDLHRSTGVVIFPLVLFRLYYRRRNPPPPLPDDLAPVQRIAAHGTHHLLYALLLIMPLLGWWGTSAWGATINVFWLFELPRLVSENRPLGEDILKIHGNLGILLTVLVATHIGAGLFHHFIRRDRILLRMLGR